MMSDLKFVKFPYNYAIISTNLLSFETYGVGFLTT